MAQKDQDIGTANAYFSFPLENLTRIRQFESYWAWIKSIFVTNLKTIEEICGKDSKIYLQFQLYCIIFLSVVTVVSLGVILPLNFSGMHIRGTRAEKGNFHHSTLANISAHSDIQWVHFFVAFLVFLLAYDMMHSFKIINFVGYQDRSDRRKNVTLMITNIPHCTKEDIKTYLEETFGVKVNQVIFTYDRKDIAKIESKLKSVEKSLEYCRRYPNTKLWSCRTSTESALKYYEKLEKELRKEWKAEFEKMKNEPPLDIVLVTFESLEQSSKVYHSFHYNYKWSNCFAKSDESDLLKPQKWRVSYAPPPWDIYWENLTNFEAIWWFKIFAFHFVVLMFVILVTTPQHLAHHFNEFIHFTLGNINESVHSSLDLFSNVWILLFTVVLPKFFRFSDNFIGYYTKSAQLRWMLMKSYSYEVLIVIIMPTFGMSYMTEVIRTMFLEDTADTARMWKCFFLGDSGAALINYTILAAFSVNGGELLLFLFWPLASRIFVAKSRADMPIIQGSPEFDFGENYIYFLLLFTLTVMFSLICPLITPFGLFYAIAKHCVDRYKMLYEHKKTRVDKSVHATAMKIMVCATLLQLALMVVYSLVYDLLSMEDMKIINALRLLFINTCSIFAITSFFLSDNFNRSLPYRRHDLESIAKMDAEQEAITKKYVHEDYVQKSEV